MPGSYDGRLEISVWMGVAQTS